MTLRIGLTARIVVVFVSFSAALLLCVAVLSYSSGSTMLQDVAVSELLSVSVAKQAQLDAWIAQQIEDVHTTASSPALLSASTVVTRAAEDPEGIQRAHTHLIDELRSRTVNVARHSAMAVIDTGGRIIAASDPSLDGASVANERFFLGGTSDTFVQYPYQSSLLRRPAMTISTPLRASNGELVGVLASWPALSELGAIIQQRGGLHQTDDAYLVDLSRRYVTVPRLRPTAKVLVTHANNEAARQCVAGNSGVYFGQDSRGVPAIMVYRWMPEHRLGLITKIDTSEAFRPVHDFGQTITWIGIALLVLTSGVAFALARTIIVPVRALQASVARFGRGELGVRIPVASDDVLGMLASEFNGMAEAIAGKESELRANAVMLEANVVSRTLALQSSEARIRSMIASAHDAFVVIDAQGLVTDWNARAESTFGFSSEEAVGKPMHTLIVPPQYRDAHQRGIANFLATGQATVLDRLIELPALHRDGHEIPVELTISPIRTQEGYVFSAFLRDITARKRAHEEQLERERALRVATDEAQAANRAKSEFLANMSHEIRTPMNGVLGTVGLLLESPLSPAQRELAGLARASGEILLTVINDILDFAKVEAGKLEMEALPFDLLLAVEEVASMMAIQASAKHLDIVVRYQPRVPRQVIGDPGRVRQVLMNLIGNAIKFTERGHVLIGVDAAEVTEDEVLFRVDVEDTGIGIEADRIESLFQKFTQADASTTRRFGGTGLGLAICRELVTQMGGTIVARSTIDVGSTFTFTLRLVRRGGEISGVRQLTELADARVLIVDDNALNRRVLRDQMTSWGIRSSTCADAESALRELRAAKLADDPFHIAILDHAMPDVDGETLGRAIKDDPDLRDVVLVMLTSMGYGGDATHFLRMGFGAFLIKPVRQSELLSVLVNVWSGTPGVVPTEIPSAQRHNEARASVAPSPSTFRREVHVLLVEDNATNQIVASLILESLGCSVDFATNGREAVQKVSTNAYDLVFMDCEMPEMDGFEATAAIRSRSDEKALVPIIALTARAIRGDRERCLAAGMNDYVAKPLQREVVGAALRRWQVPRRTPALDPEVIGRLRELSNETGSSFLEEILDIFRADAAERIHAMRGAVTDRDITSLRAAAHSLKSASGNVGARLMADFAEQLEGMGDDIPIESATPLIDRLEIELARVNVEIVALRALRAPAAPSEDA